MLPYVPAVGAGGKIFVRLLRGWKTVCEYVHVYICDGRESAISLSVISLWWLKQKNKTWKKPY